VPATQGFQLRRWVHPDREEKIFPPTLELSFSKRVISTTGSNAP
jgi:hypothetical protein